MRKGNESHEDLKGGNKTPVWVAIRLAAGVTKDPQTLLTWAPLLSWQHTGLYENIFLLAVKSWTCQTHVDSRAAVRGVAQRVQHV